MYNVNCCRNASVSEKGPVPRYTESDEVKKKYVSKEYSIGTLGILNNVK